MEKELEIQKQVKDFMRGRSDEEKAAIFLLTCIELNDNAAEILIAQLTKSLSARKSKKDAPLIRR